jgi:menaquinol-cytochrome c reductase cytochrome b/c subunit
MPRLTARERREAYQREYQFQKRTGKPFFPYAILHDSITSLITVALIIGLAIVWHAQFHAVPKDPTAGREGGFLGPAYEDRANPGVERYDPRPEWYFFFLFQLLRIFDTPQLLLFGTIIIPTILMVALFALPFIDRRPERRISRRPVAAVLLILVPFTLLYLTQKGSQVPPLATAASGHAGSGGFAVSGLGCASCHTLKDAGATGTVGPNLDTAKPSYELALDRLTNGKGGMPKFAGKPGVTDDVLKCMAGYVSTWAGANGNTPGPKASTAKGYPASCDAAGGIYKGSGPGAAG